MNNKAFYLPINSSILAEYLGRGIIVPRKYMSTRITDIQSKYDEQIFLIEEKWITGEYSNDCSLEIVLVPSEIENLDVIENYAFLNGSIPITRIKRIFFKSEDQKRKTIYNIEQGDAFVPKIVEVDQSPDAITLNVGKLLGNRIKNNNLDRIKQFNQLLGGFACMKLAGKLNKEYKSNYSENYFATLGAINTIIKHDVEIAKLSSKSNVLNVFLPSTEPKWDSDFLDILKSDSKSENEFLYSIEKYAKKNKNIGLLNAIKGPLGVKWDYIKETDSYSIALAILQRYGVGKRKTTTDLFNDMSSGKMPFIRKNETLLFLYGFHYGYAHFRNAETLNNKEESVKYLMNSQLDYFTIESIYQAIFRNNFNTADFEYLTSWCPQFVDSNKNDVYIIDVPVYGFRPEQKGLFQKISEEIISFFLEGYKARYGESLYNMIKTEVTKKLNNILSKISDLELENNNLRTQKSNIEYEVSKLKQQIFTLEKEKYDKELKSEQLLKENEDLRLKLNSLNTDFNRKSSENLKNDFSSEIPPEYRISGIQHSNDRQTAISAEIRDMSYKQINENEIDSFKEPDKKVRNKAKGKKTINTDIPFPPTE